MNWHEVKRADGNTMRCLDCGREITLALDGPDHTECCAYRYELHPDAELVVYEARVSRGGPSPQGDGLGAPLLGG